MSKLLQGYFRCQDNGKSAIGFLNIVFFSLFVLKLVICRKNAVWSGVPALAREVPGPWHFVEKMVTMFVRSKNVGGWSRCQDSRECAATKRGKIDVKTVYKIGKNMGWIILKRGNPSVSRQCSTACFFFLPVPEAATVFSLCPQSCIV